jgi:SAM-dependent methyltransferase
MVKDKRLTMEPADKARITLANWFEAGVGQQVFATEQALHDELLEDSVGYHLLQISAQVKRLYDRSPIPNKRRVAELAGLTPDLIASPRQMPVLEDQIDVVLLHHLLEFVHRPQSLLTEAARMVMPQGVLIITGFNPLSLWGLRGFASRGREDFPFNGKFLASSKLMDWLNVLNFKIDRVLYAEFGLPMFLPWVRPPDFGLGLGRRYNLPFGGVFVIVARKYIGPLTPSPSGRQRRFLRFSGLSLPDRVPDGLTPSPKLTIDQQRLSL